MPARLVPRRGCQALLALCAAVAVGAAAATPAAAITPTITEFTNGMAAFTDPTTITLGPDGNLWFTGNTSPGHIGKVTPQGTITMEATGGSNGLTSNPQPNGIVSGPDGNLWFTEGRNPGRIGNINPTTGAVHEPATGGLGGFTANSAPQEIANGPDGNLWFAEAGSSPTGGAVARITTAGVVTEFTSGLTSGEDVEAITPGAAADGNLWFTEDKSGANKIGRIDPATGAITEFSNGLNPSGELRDIVPGPGGDVWFAQLANPGQIGKIAPDGTITEVATGGVTPGFTADLQPDGIAEGPDGALWFTQPNDPIGPASIGRFDPATGTVQEFPTPTADSAPLQIVVGPDGNLWFPEETHNAIARITTPPAATTTSAVTSGSSSATVAGIADGHAQATSFHVEYGLPGGPTSTTAEQVLGSTAGPTAVSAGLSGLASATTYQARLVVTNPTGATAGAFVTFTTAPLGAPKLTRVRESAKRWREGHALPRISRHRRVHTGTTFSFSLDQPATVKLVFHRLTNGRRVKGRCVPPSKRGAHRPRCTRSRGAGRLRESAHAGANRLRFAGRLSKRTRLKPGAYQVLITATNPAGKTSRTARLKFTIVR